MSVDVLNFGCRLNAAESEIIQQHAESAQLSNAVIVNTCAVTGEAVRQARQAIRRSRRERPEARIIVTGCAVQAYPQKFLELPDVALVLGNDDKISAKLWRELADDLADTPEMRGKSYVGDIMAATDMVAPQIERFAAHTRAFVQIQTGCDHRCTFCVIPFGRGNSRSLSPDEVIAQVRRVTEAGHREVVLTGVDITSYRPSLGALVKRILKETPALERLRLSSIDSVEADADLLDAFANDARLMPHLHLSLQHGDDLILKRIKHGNPVYSADKSHFHHRFLAIGWSQRRTVLAIYAWTGLMCLLALAMRFVPYTDGHGDWNAGWTALLAVMAALGLAGAVYLVYVLEILKWRSEPVITIVRRHRGRARERVANRP